MNLDEMFEEAERMARAEAALDEARRATPEWQARDAARRQREFDLGVREGWWDAEGNTIEQPEEDDEEEEDEA